MKIGIGTDIIEVERVAEKMEKKAGFKELVFSADEILYCEAKTFKYEHYAARFAAKEAFLKAIGCGIDFSIDLKEISISNYETGQPYFILSEIVKEFLMKKLGFVPETQISLSHSRQQAIAFVLFNKK